MVKDYLSIPAEMVAVLRDVANVVKYFRKLGVEDASEEGLLETIKKAQTPD